RDFLSLVVPANAGTHTPRPTEVAHGETARLTTRIGGYGSLRSQVRRRWEAYVRELLHAPCIKSSKMEELIHGTLSAAVVARRADSDSGSDLRLRRAALKHEPTWLGWSAAQSGAGAPAAGIPGHASLHPGY